MFDFRLTVMDTYMGKKVPTKSSSIISARYPILLNQREQKKDSRYMQDNPFNYLCAIMRTSTHSTGCIFTVSVLLFTGVGGYNGFKTPLSKFLGGHIHMSYFGATGTHVFGFLVMSPLGFKARVGSTLFEL